ncbi:MAG TPA: hypothetical protein VHK65_03970 [Candidatus Dormibacteraeota bacterium]|nr:hypothetical protein [Candidatus Dormibacteraeota bacterium]
MVFLMIDPGSDFLRGAEGNTLGRVIVIPPAFFGGLLVITALTGLPMWRIARPIAIALEGLCTPLNWIFVSVAGITGPLSLVLACLPLSATIVLLTRHSANAWFHDLAPR